MFSTRLAFAALKAAFERAPILDLRLMALWLLGARPPTGETMRPVEYEAFAPRCPDLHHVATNLKDL